MGGLGTCTNIPRRADPQPLERFAAVNASALAARGRLPGSVTRWRFGGSIVDITVVHATLISVVVDGGEPTPIGIVRQGLFEQQLLVCPGCKRWRRALVCKDAALTCRRCASLDYRIRHEARRGLPRLLHFIGKARQRLGADPTPFTDLPPRPYGWTWKAYDRRVAEITALESQALAALGGVVKAAKLRAKRVRR